MRWKSVNFQFSRACGRYIPILFLRFDHLEMCYFYVSLHMYETQVHRCTGNAISGIPHPKLQKSFLTDTYFHFL